MNTPHGFEPESITAAQQVKGIPNGTGADKWAALAHSLTGIQSAKMEIGQVTRADRMLGRFLESMAASRGADLRRNLIRLAAFALAWVNELDAKAARGTSEK